MLLHYIPFVYEYQWEIQRANGSLNKQTNKQTKEHQLKKDATQLGVMIKCHVNGAAHGTPKEIIVAHL